MTQTVKTGEENYNKNMDLVECPNVEYWWALNNPNKPPPPQQLITAERQGREGGPDQWISCAALERKKGGADENQINWQ